MRVLAACSLGGAGHLGPLLPFLDAARRAGHETLVIAPFGLADMVRDAGHGFFVGGEPDEAVVGPIREQLPLLPVEQASELANRDLFGRLATTAMLPAMDAVMREWKPDGVLRDPCEYSSMLATWSSGVVTAQVGIGMAEVEGASIGVATPALEAHRTGLVDQLLDAPYLTRFPASLDPSPFPDTRRFSEPQPGASDTLPFWWGRSSAPLVYVSFGTVLGHMSIAAQVYRAVTDAVAGPDARVLLTVGRHFDPTQLTDVPANVHVEPWVDQRQVLADAALVVCHGGSGTTFAALAAAVPVVIVPMFADQFTNAARVAQAGAGLAVENDLDDRRHRRPPSSSDAPRLRRAIDEALATESYRQSAQRMAHEMASAPTIDVILGDLLRIG